MADLQQSPPPELQLCLDSVDQLLADLRRALSTQDWDELERLNQRIKPALEPLMKALEAGQLDSELVRVRLEELRKFTDAAGESATQAKAEAELALKGVNRNHNAAKAYQNISTPRLK